MVLLEFATKEYPTLEHFFSKYSTSDLIYGAHDLIQYAYSDGQTGLEEQTRELLATLAACDRYQECGGHLFKPPAGNAEQNESPQRAGFLKRIRSRFGR